MLLHVCQLRLGLCVFFCILPLRPRGACLCSRNSQELLEVQLATSPQENDTLTRMRKIQRTPADRTETSLFLGHSCSDGASDKRIFPERILPRLSQSRNRNDDVTWNKESAGGGGGVAATTPVTKWLAIYKKHAQGMPSCSVQQTGACSLARSFPPCIGSNRVERHPVEPVRVRHQEILQESHMQTDVFHCPA